MLPAAAARPRRWQVPRGGQSWAGDVVDPGAVGRCVLPGYPGSCEVSQCGAAGADSALRGRAI